MSCSFLEKYEIKCELLNGLFWSALALVISLFIFVGCVTLLPPKISSIMCSIPFSNQPSQTQNTSMPVEIYIQIISQIKYVLISITLISGAILSLVSIAFSGIFFSTFAKAIAKKVRDKIQ